MILCGVVSVLLLAGALLLRRYPVFQKIKKAYAILAAFAVLGFLSGLSGRMDSGQKEQLVRNPPGEGELETEAVFYVEEDETEYEMMLSIPEWKYRASEETAYLTAAVKEIDATFCGGNQSLEEIRHDPHIQKSYQNGVVKAEWAFSDGAVISSEGKIDQEALKEIPHQIEATVVLSCGEQKENYEFTFCVIPLQKNKKERLIADIKEQVAEAEPTQKTVALPEYADGKKIIWKQKTQTRAVEILIFGILAAVTVVYTEREQKIRQAQKTKRRLLLEYPEFVGKLSLLLGAGMTISGALRKIDQMHQSGKKHLKEEPSGVYVPLHQMICEMENGMSEVRAYQEFAKRCDLQPYRKLVSLLVSGQKIGNRNLMDKLEEEAERVFLERKNTARKLGEEASTKLLIPMMLMLMVVMGIVIVPAFLSIYGI
ncbi:hypothetical protein H8S17_07395 [Roseburia sp. BX1005]|uniref:Type II secretion system protein GspF domain-containing protein n=1 Tax=Roseburia zhanii TaxID=2763064 RepID=A0A923LNL1_9FIRM|nr:hypothetical protein [Roseburia zhanii]MBC5714033.1 hypothetical protein [Roseburia zhanii]